MADAWQPSNGVQGTASTTQGLMQLFASLERYSERCLAWPPNHSAAAIPAAGSAVIQLIQKAECQAYTALCTQYIISTSHWTPAASCRQVLASSLSRRLGARCLDYTPFIRMPILQP